MLVCGAPVADRAWAIPHWMDCLAGQTRQPDALVFIHSSHGSDVKDATWRTVWQEADHHGFPVTMLHDERPPHARHDNARFATLADLRNRLLQLAAMRGADLFLSLDTDLMLEDPGTIERLEHLVTVDDFDVASVTAFLHPMAPRAWTPEVEPCWAYNFGFFPDQHGQVSDTRRWTRPAIGDIPWGSVVVVDIPMAVWLGTRRALQCRYSAHESGEDVGFGQSLQRAGLVSVVDTGLYARHVWADVDLHREQLEAA